MTCRQLQEEALHSTLVVPRENHTVGGGHCLFSCGGTTRGRSSPLSATCKTAGKGRSLTLSTPTELPRLWLRSVLSRETKAHVPQTRQRSSRTRQTANTHYRASPPENQGLSSHSLSHASTFHRTTGSRHLGLPDQSSTGRVKLNRCLYIKATREELTWSDSVRH